MTTRVKSFKSITAKLFYLTVGLVIFAVSLNSWQNASAFKTQLTRQMESNTISASEGAGTALVINFRNWENQLRVIVTALLGSPESLHAQQFSSFLKANDQLVSVALYRQPAKGQLVRVSHAETPFTNGEEFEGKAANEVFLTLEREVPAALNRDIEDDHKTPVHAMSLWKATKIPAFALARRFEANGTKEVYWGVVVIWLAPINALLPSGGTSRSVVLDDRGQLFSSRSMDDFKKPNAWKNLDIVRMALRSNVTSAFKGGYFDANGHERIGAYYKIPGFNITVLVEEDAQVAYSAVQKIVNKTVLYGALFVLLAIFLSYLGAAGVTSPLREVTTATQEIAAGNFNTDLRPRMQDEVGVLATSVNTMAKQIKHLLASQVEKARVEKELETAQAVQTTLFPAARLEKQGLLISGFSRPASECGGDWWGHFTGKDGTEFVFIADAMGHGVPAALVTAMAYSSFMTLANLISEDTASSYTPKDLLQEFNKVLYHAVRGTISMTIFAIAFDVKRGTVTYANAGHNFPVFVPRDGKDDRLDKKLIKQHKESPVVPMSLSARGTIVGVEQDIDIEQKSFALRPGDKFLLFTDGLIECKNPEGREWGKKTFTERIKAAGTVSGEELKQKIIEEAYTFFAGHPADDDVTLVVIEYGGAGATFGGNENGGAGDKTVAMEPLPLPPVPTRVAATGQAPAPAHDPNHPMPAWDAPQAVPEPVTTPASEPFTAPAHEPAPVTFRDSDEPTLALDGVLPPLAHSHEPTALTRAESRDSADDGTGQGAEGRDEPFVLGADTFAPQSMPAMAVGAEPAHFVPPPPPMRRPPATSAPDSLTENAVAANAQAPVFGLDLGDDGLTGESASQERAAGPAEPSLPRDHDKAGEAPIAKVATAPAGANSDATPKSEGDEDGMFTSAIKLGA